MASSMKAALHLGKDVVKNSEIHLNTKFENIESVFEITQKIDTGTVWRNSKSCQCSTTSCGNQMIRIPSQTESMSRITRSSSFQDTGRFLVQAQRRDGTEILTNNRDSGISQEIRWYTKSKKPPSQRRTWTWCVSVQLRITASARSSP